MKFISVSLRNFLSYGNNFTTVNLDFTEPTLILGKNLDSSVDGAVDSNGSGKTTILHAITYALYDNTIEDIEKNNLINNINKKNMEVELTFDKDGVIYKIIRFRKNSARGGDGVLFMIEKDGQFKDITKSSVSETNNFITSIIGIPFEVFTRIVAISATHEPFLSLPASHTSKANQRDFLENLFGYTEISQKAELLKEKIKTTNSDLNLHLGILEEIKQAEERYQYQINSLKEKKISWDSSQSQKIIQIKQFIESHDINYYNDLLASVEELALIQRERDRISDQIESNKKKELEIKNNNIKYYKWISDNEQKVKDIQDYLQSVDEELIISKIEVCELLEKYKKESSELEILLTKLNSENKTLSETIKQTEKEISHLVESKCPYCLQKYESASLKVDELELKIVEYKSSLTENNKNIIEIQNKLKKITNKVTTLKEHVGADNIVTLNKKLNEIKNKKEQLESIKSAENPYSLLNESSIDNTELSIKLDESIAKIAELQRRLNGNNRQSLNSIILQINTSINELNSLVNAENPYQQAIQELEQNPPKKCDYSKIEELRSEIEHQNFLYKLLTKKDSFIRKNLLNKNIPLLNNRLQMYLKKMGLPHQVQFTDNMTAEIKQFGTSINYGNLSAGQKARINLALSFAFRDVLQARHGKISFCILDECLDVGLGSLGVLQAVKMIKSVAVENKLSMLVISHRDEVTNMFSKTINVELKNGFSTLTQ
jgi:DNA repair exonuclease SbcCD ATPase subunit